MDEVSCVEKVTNKALHHLYEKRTIRSTTKKRSRDDRIYLRRGSLAQLIVEITAKGKGARSRLRYISIEQTVYDNDMNSYRKAKDTVQD